MKTFVGKYYRSYNFGAYDDYICVVTANTKSEALGLVLNEYERTTANYWSLEEIELNTPGVLHVQNDCV